MLEVSIVCCKSTFDTYLNSPFCYEYITTIIKQLIDLPLGRLIAIYLVFLQPRCLFIKVPESPTLYALVVMTGASLRFPFESNRLGYYMFIYYLYFYWERWVAIIFTKNELNRQKAT